MEHHRPWPIQTLSGGRPDAPPEKAVHGGRPAPLRPGQMVSRGIAAALGFWSLLAQGWTTGLAERATVRAGIEKLRARRKAGRAIHLRAGRTPGMRRQTHSARVRGHVVLFM